jgi:hypothetical protein
MELSTLSYMANSIRLVANTSERIRDPGTGIGPQCGLHLKQTSGYSNAVAGSRNSGETIKDGES